MRNTRRAGKGLLWLVAALILMSGVPALAVELPRNETLYVAGHLWGPPTNSNPLAPTVLWPVNNAVGASAGYVYEPLFLWNMLDGSYEPLLGRSMEWVDDQTLRVELQPGTRWQDGRPLTSRDVVFTFELARRYTLAYTSFWEYVEAVRAVDDRTVEVILDPAKPDRLGVQATFAVQNILPEHIWAPIADQGRQALLEHENLYPVGSGPYKIIDYTTDRVVLERYEDYWGKSLYGMPAPRYVVGVVFQSNDAANLALQQGVVDWAQTFVPRVWTLRNVGTWYDKEPYYVPGAIPIVIINVHRKGLDNPLVRKAIAYSIDYATIARVAMSSYSEPARSSLILPGGFEAEYFDEQAVEQYGWKYDPPKAVDILENQLGARKGSDGIYVLPDGTRLSFTVQTPYGWTDWMTALEIMAQSARAVGIELRTEFPQEPVVTSNLQYGNFDMGMRYGPEAQPISPRNRFQHVMDIRTVPPIGQQAIWQNWGRFEHPDVARLLDEAAAATSPEELKRIYGELDRIFMEYVPAIPLMYRPSQFYQFNDTYWKNWPTAANPVAPPDYSIRVLRALRPVR